MKLQCILLMGLFMVSCEQNTPKKAISQETTPSKTFKEFPKKVQVLNFATFHMGTTTDANSVDFDENNRKNQQDAKEIARLIAAFEPTIICVEVPPEKNAELNEKYKEFLSNPEKPIIYYGEVGMVAFEVGRLCKIDSLQGIDHKMGYNYKIGEEIENAIDATTYKEFFKNPFKDSPGLTIHMDTLALLDKLRMMNHPKFLDFLITINADILAYTGTKNGFEGADEAAKYYQRNLRIYSNLNRIPMTKEDRVFILSGGSHTAFLNEFFERSIKYETVNVLDYLK